MVAVVALVVGAAVGCTSDAQIFGLGEGAGDTIGYQVAYIDSGGAGELGQPATAVEPWSFGCRQLFAGGRSRTAVLLQQPCGGNQQVFAVSGEFWELYRAAGDAAPVRYGFPLGRQGEWQGGWTQGFGQRGGFQAFFMQRPGGRPHVVSVPILGYYLSFDDRHARFGYPTAEAGTTADGRTCQEFEHATVVVTTGDERTTFEKTATGSPACRPES